METVRYKRAHFSARFPRHLHYSRSHYWISPPGGAAGGGVDRAGAAGGAPLRQVGFTKFATRMLGELVDAYFDVAVGAAITPGQMIGAVEGFKAATEVYSAVEGEFRGINPVLQENACIVRSSPYADGWLYAVAGEPEPGHLDVEGYIGYLDSVIDQMMQDPKYAEGAGA